MQGFVFFGSAQRMGKKLQSVAVALVNKAAHLDAEDNAVENSLQTLGEVYSGPKHATDSKDGQVLHRMVAQLGGAKAVGAPLCQLLVEAPRQAAGS